MFIDWTKHIKDQEEKDNFVSQVQRSKPVLNRLLELVIEKERALDLSEIDPKTFDNPNWANKQAYKIGIRAGLNGFKQLIDLDQQEK